MYRSSIIKDFSCGTHGFGGVGNVTKFSKNTFLYS